MTGHVVVEFALSGGWPSLRVPINTGIFGVIGHRCVDLFRAEEIMSEGIRPKPLLMDEADSLRGIPSGWLEVYTREREKALNSLVYGLDS